MEAEALRDMKRTICLVVSGILLSVTCRGAVPESQAKTLQIPVRWGPVMQSRTAEENTESRERYVERTWSLAVNQTALILVDVWDKHSNRSHMDRALQNVNTCIAPLLRAARDAGLLVIHAPSPEIAVRYPQWQRYAGDAGRETATERLLRQTFRDALQASGLPAGIQPIVDSIPPAVRAMAQPDPDWPPPDFKKRTGAYTQYARERPESWREEGRSRDIPKIVQPRPDEFVIASGDQLHRLLQDKKILHLLYVGFATNKCVQNSRDYSMEQMGRRGYNCILVRDCTTGIENAYTVEGLWLTKVAMQQIEKAHASALSTDLLKAFAAGR